MALVVVALVLILSGAVLIAAMLGPYRATPAEILSAILRIGSPPNGPVDTILFQIRLPRVMAALLVGAALAAAGASYQTLFRNPLVSPDILGVSAGAGFGAVLGILLSLPVFAIQALGFATGLATVLVVYGLAHALRSQNEILVLVLAGIVVGSLAGAGISLVKILADPYNQLPAITFWLLGSLSGVTGGDVRATLPALLLGLAPLWLLRWRLNVMTLGEDEARALGVDTRRTRALVVTGATLVTSAMVSISGTIGWVGLYFSPGGSRLYGSYQYGVRCWDATPLAGAARSSR